MIINWIKENLLPGFEASKANKRIKKESEELKEAKVVFPKSFDVESNLKLLEGDLEDQLNRKKIVEDKAKAILGTISIAITAITFALINQKLVFSDFISVIEVAFLLLSIISFIMAIIRAIQSMNIREYYLKQGIKEHREGGKISLEVDHDPKSKFEELLYFKMMNNNTLLQNSNYAFAAFVLVRNGLLSFTMFFIISLFGRVIGNCC